MKVNYDWATTKTTITLSQVEAVKLVVWFEVTTGQASDPEADTPSKLEDIIREILES